MVDLAKPLTPKIQKLPNFLIDQIKAGEVIESPSALIKELLENSIDAQATSIDIEIIDNGISKITVSDNGLGITYCDLSLAFQRHATSKIKNYDDLYKLYSFGFRGEALASAASISRIHCTSATKSGAGGRIIIEGGKEIASTPLALEVQGTTIVIADLFYNTPVRMKFIKGKKSEKKSISRILYAYILTNPQISFSIKWDSEEKKRYPQIIEDNRKIERRALQIFPWLKDINDLISFRQEYNDHIIEGFLQISSTRSSSKRAHFLFANQRLFTEQSYHYQITQLGKRIWKEGEQGSYILFFKIPPKHIDVNIHPSKTRIKFAQSSDVYALLSSTLKNRIKIFLQENSHNECSTTLHTLPKIELKKSSIKESTDIDQKESSPLQFLSPGVSLFSKNGQFYLIDEHSLVTLLFAQSFSNNFPEESAIPLLITTPFSISNNSESLLYFFHNHGIIFEPLNHSTLLLKALPQQLVTLPLRELFQYILNHYNQPYSWRTLLPQDFNYHSILRATPQEQLNSLIEKNIKKWFIISRKAIGHSG